MNLSSQFPYRFIVPGSNYILDRWGNLTEIFYATHDSVESVTGSRAFELVSAGRRFIKALNLSRCLYVDFRFSTTTNFRLEKDLYWSVPRDPEDPVTKFCEEKWKYIDDLSREGAIRKQHLIITVTYSLENDDRRTIKNAVNQVDINRYYRNLTKSLKSACYKFKLKLESFLPNIRRLGFHVMPYTLNSKFDLLYQYFNDSRFGNIHQFNPSLLNLADSLYRSKWQTKDKEGNFFENAIKVGDEYRGVLSLFKQPYFADFARVEGLFNSELLKDCECVIKFYPWAREDFNKELRENQFSFDDLIQQDRKGSADHEAHAQELQDLVELLAKGEAEMSKVGIYVLVKDKNLDRLNSRMRQIQIFFSDYFDSCYMRIHEKSELQAALQVCAPGNTWERSISPFQFGLTKKFHQPAQLKSWADIDITQMIPYGGAFRGCGENLNVFLGRQNQIVNCDGRGSASPHTVICSPTGGGKSTLMQDIIFQEKSLKNSYFVIFDKDRSYERMVLKHGGQVVRPDTGNQKCTINPFHLPPNTYYNQDINEDNKRTDSKDIGDWLNLALADISENERLPIELYGTLTKHLNAFLQISNDKLREGVIDWKNLPTLSRFNDYIIEQQKVTQSEHLERINKRLNVLTSKNGIYGQLFDGQTKVDFSNPLTVVDFKELSGRHDLVSLYVVIYVTNLSSVITDRGRRKTICIDECRDAFLPSKKFRQAIADSMLRIGRKLFLNLIFATQNFSDFTDYDDIGENFYNNVGSFYLAKSDDLECIARTKRWSPSECNLFNSLSSGAPHYEWMFWRDFGAYRAYGVIKPIISPYQSWLTFMDGNVIDIFDKFQAHAVKKNWVSQKNSVDFTAKCLSTFFGGDEGRLGLPNKENIDLGKLLQSEKFMEIVESHSRARAA